MAGPAVPAEPAVLTRWTAISPFGLGGDQLVRGLAAGRPTVAALDPSIWDGPLDRAALIPDFSPSAVLGARGTRAMDRITGIVVATVGMLLDESGLRVGEQGGLTDPDGVGLVVGTSGSVQSVMDFTRDTLTGEKPYHVDPARFPNAVMNRAAGQSAIWYGLRGPNATIAGGAVTGLLALSYAVRLVRFGRCDVLLCGAAEEFSPQRAWLSWQAWDGIDPLDPHGEGCVMFLLESAAHARRCGRVALASVLSTGFGAPGGSSGFRQALARCIEEALARAGAVPDRVALVAASGARGLLGKEETAALTDALGPVSANGSGGPDRLDPRRLLGDTAAASAGFQLAAVLAAARGRPEFAGRLALVSSLDPAGGVGCAVLEIDPEPGSS
jgi:3-oxoacyl-[acyl-carrier-protein] synthase II